MDELKNFAEGVVVPLLLSLLGGAARVFRSGFTTWGQFAAGLFISGFAGVIVHLLLQDVNLSASVKAALVGLSGYSGGVILDGLSKRAQHKVTGFIEPWDGSERRKQGPADGAQRRKHKRTE